MGAINFHEKDAGTNHRGEGGLQKVTTNQSPHRPVPPASSAKAKSLLPPVVLAPGPRFSSLGPAAATKSIAIALPRNQSLRRCPACNRRGHDRDYPPSQAGWLADGARVSVIADAVPREPEAAGLLQRAQELRAFAPSARAALALHRRHHRLHNLWWRR